MHVMAAHAVQQLISLRAFQPARAFQKRRKRWAGCEAAQELLAAARTLEVPPLVAATVGIDQCPASLEEHDSTGSLLAG